MNVCYCSQIHPARAGKRLYRPVFLIYQRLARKAVEVEDELHEDENDQVQVQNFILQIADGSLWLQLR